MTQIQKVPPAGEKVGGVPIFRATSERKTKPVKVNEDQIAIVLNAVVAVESWDGQHDSIDTDESGGWRLIRVNGMRMPAPTRKLADIIRGLTR